MLVLLGYNLWLEFAETLVILKRELLELEVKDIQGKIYGYICSFQGLLVSGEADVAEIQRPAMWRFKRWNERHYNKDRVNDNIYTDLLFNGLLHRLRDSLCRLLDDISVGLHGYLSVLFIYVQVCKVHANVDDFRVEN